MENEALSIEDLSSQLVAADNPEQPDADSGQQATEGGEEGDHEETPEGEGAAEADADAGEGEAEQPDKDSAGEKRIHKWETASGEKFEVPESELRAGYMRTEDYTKKTQAIAETVRSGEKQVQEKFQMLQGMAGEIATVRGIQSEIEKIKAIDWPRLRAESPETAQQLDTRFLTLKEELREAQGALQAKHQHLTHAQKQSIAEAQAAAADFLKSKVKGFDNKSLNALNDACLKAGHDPQSLSGITDKHVVLDLWKARQWDALQAKKPEVTNRVRNLPPATAGKPARSTVTATKQQEVAKAISGTKNFSMRDFAGLLKATR